MVSEKPGLVSCVSGHISNFAISAKFNDFIIFIFYSALAFSAYI